MLVICMDEIHGTRLKRSYLILNGSKIQLLIGIIALMLMWITNKQTKNYSSIRCSVKYLFHVTSFPIWLEMLCNIRGNADFNNLNVCLRMFNFLVNIASEVSPSSHMQAALSGFPNLHSESVSAWLCDASVFTHDKHFFAIHNSCCHPYPRCYITAFLSSPFPPHPAFTLDRRPCPPTPFHLLSSAELKPPTPLVVTLKLFVCLINMTLSFPPCNIMAAAQT